MAALLARGVAVIETQADVPEQTLFAAEAAVVADAVAKRRAEFATARDCARRALARLGRPPVAILPGPQREPQWPPGIVGSLTHCDGYRAAAVAHARDFAALGIDAEPNRPAPAGVAEIVAVGAEPSLLCRLQAAEPAIAWDRLLFSAKESIYKAWFPLAGRWLGFEDCELSIRLDDRTFSGRLLVPGPLLGGAEITRFEGRFTVAAGRILTAVSVRARA